MRGSVCEYIKGGSKLDHVLGKLSCNYTGVTSAERVNVQDVALHPATEFANFSLAPNPTAQSALPSAVYSIALRTVEECQTQAAKQQSCGFLFVDGYDGPPVGSCGLAAKYCCFLNPYLNCSKSAGSGNFTRFGVATLGIFGSPRVFDHGSS